MEDKTKAEEAIAKIQPYFSAIGNSEQEEFLEAWAKFGGFGELKMTVDD